MMNFSYVKKDNDDMFNWDGRCISPDKINKNISSIWFSTHRYGDTSHTIYFDKSVTCYHAVNEAEKYLSNIKYDEYGPPASYLEDIEITDGSAIIVTGS